MEVKGIIGAGIGLILFDKVLKTAQKIKPKEREKRKSKPRRYFRI